MFEMKGTISVIIPIYNVQKYLVDCLESVVSQTYGDLQIILIDDGSTDGSDKICDIYAKKDKRIIVVHQKNMGAAHAKNVGLSLARGNMLTFLDGDDFLEQDAFEFMVNCMEGYNADIVQCSFRKIYKNYIKVQDNILSVHQFDCSEYLEKFISDWTCGLLWDKLYKRKIFDGILFEEGHKIDDEFFTYRGVMNANRIVQSPKIIYNYRQRQSGIMHSKMNKEKILLDKLDYLNIRRKEISEKYPDLKCKFDFHYLNMLLILSKDENITKFVLKILKRRLNEFILERNTTDISARFKMNLVYLKYCPIIILFMRRNRLVKKTNKEYQYYE